MKSTQALQMALMVISLGQFLVSNKQAFVIVTPCSVPVADKSHLESG